MKNLKKIALSGLVACLVVGFSAFKYDKSDLTLAPLFITGLGSTPGTYTYDVVANTECQEEELDFPCQITTLPGYTPSSPNEIPIADVEDPNLVEINSWRPEL
jgi:hypothetical protein